LTSTIAAIATPLGEGGLAVIRSSGAQALAVADRCFTPVGRIRESPSEAATHHRFSTARFMRADRHVDEVLCAVMRAPRTYTARGRGSRSRATRNPLVEDRARHRARKMARGWPSRASSTKLAFLNGRLDLTQASRPDMIQSRTELALTAANEQLAGKLGQRSTNCAKI